MINSYEGPLAGRANKKRAPWSSDMQKCYIMIINNK
jgi:hypothetical protein